MCQECEQSETEIVSTKLLVWLVAFAGFVAYLRHDPRATGICVLAVRLRAITPDPEETQAKGYALAIFACYVFGLGLSMVTGQILSLAFWLISLAQ